MSSQPSTSAIEKPGDRQMLYTIPEAARVLRLSRSGVYTEMSSGRLASIKIGRRRLIAAPDIEVFVTNMRQANLAARHV